MRPADLARLQQHHDGRAVRVLSFTMRIALIMDVAPR